MGDRNSKISGSEGNTLALYLNKRNTQQPFNPSHHYYTIFYSHYLRTLISEQYPASSIPLSSVFSSIIGSCFCQLKYNHMQILPIIGQAAVFVLGVYLERTIRKRIFSREKGKEVKQTMRIIVCTLISVGILFYNQTQICAPSSIGFLDCFYLRVNFLQILHVLIANTLLFGTHIFEKFQEHPLYLRAINVKSIIVAPILEELVFRASFFRSANNRVSVFILALVFSLSHLHRPVRKWLKGKQPNWVGGVGQVVFTLVFGLYSFYFLSSWLSVVPSIVLHCYCNYLGPPSIHNLYFHLLCIVAAIAYCYVFVN